MEKELYKNVDEFLISQVCAILEDNKIPYIKQFDGAGSYININMGTNINMKRILVSEEDYARAIEVISVLNNINTTEFKDVDDKELNEKEKIRKLKIASIIWIPILILIASIFAIAGYFIN